MKVCRNQKVCNRQRHELGIGTYYVGDYTTKGCFYRGDTAYFGVGGTIQEKSKSDLQGGKVRIWCGGSSNQSGGNTSNQSAPKETSSPVASPKPIVQLVEQPEKKEYCIDIELVTDDFSKDETGFMLTTNPTDGSPPKKLLDFPIGSLESNESYTKQVCVPKGKYTFTMLDNFHGICCSFGKGEFTVKIDGDEIITGGNFKTKTVSYDILAGYDPGLTSRDKEWLEAHNTRREKFHKQHNTEYRPLHWSNELAQDASTWVDKILPTCKVVREGIDEGENMSVQRFHGARNDQEPENVVVSSYHVLLNLPPNDYLSHTSPNLTFI